MKVICPLCHAEIDERRPKSFSEEEWESFLLEDHMLLTSEAGGCSEHKY